MKKVVTAAVLHDPNSLLVDNFVSLANQYPIFDESFYLVVSRVTPTSPYRLVAPAMNIVIQQDFGIADARRLALKTFNADVSKDNSHIFLVDFDRLLYWLHHDYESLQAVKEAGVNHPFTVIGRKPETWSTYPEPQRSTERAINAYTSHKFALDNSYDVVAGAYVMDRSMSEFIFKASHALVPGAVDVEWFALALEMLEWWLLDIRHIQVDGLGYEGIFLGIEAYPITDETARKRYDNLSNARAMIDIMLAWQSFPQRNYT